MNQLLYANRHLAAEILESLKYGFQPSVDGEGGPVKPPGPAKMGVDSKTYQDYREGLDSACVDVVTATIDDQGVPRVLAIKRGPDKPFSGKMWMQGGALHSYVSTVEFVEGRSEKECGVRPKIVAMICVARTCAPDFTASTCQPCYLGLVSFDQIRIKYDKDHSDGRLLSLKDLADLPESERHWYPMRAFTESLKALQRPNIKLLIMK